MGWLGHILIQRPVYGGMAVTRHIGGEHTDLAAGDVPRGVTISTAHAA